MAGRCGCGAAGGCACSLISSGTVAVSGNGADPAWSPAIRFSADADNAAAVGTDGGLYVPAAGPGGAGSAFLVSGAGTPLPLDHDASFAGPASRTIGPPGSIWNVGTQTIGLVNPAASAGPALIHLRGRFALTNALALTAQVFQLVLTMTSTHSGGASTLTSRAAAIPVATAPVAEDFFLDDILMVPSLPSGASVISVAFAGSYRMASGGSISNGDLSLASLTARGIGGIS